MARFNCFSILVRKKKSKRIANALDASKGPGILPVKLEHPINSSEKKLSNSTSFGVLVPLEIQGNSTCKVKVVEEENSVRPEKADTAYEGGDEHDGSSPMTRDLSDFDLQALAAKDGVEAKLSMNKNDRSYHSAETGPNDRLEKDEDAVELMEVGHVSDPGMGRTAFWGSPKLKRSCSNIETRNMHKKIGNQLPPTKSQSFEDLQKLAQNREVNFIQGIQTSPLSVVTSCSADKVMLKRRSSSQVLPSRSRRLWWKLFLWSHRNLHKPAAAKSKSRLLSIKNAESKNNGYSSDTLEPSHSPAARKNKGKEPLVLAGPFSAKSKNKCNGSSSLWHQNHWVAFRAGTSPSSRVDEWVNSLEADLIIPPDGYDQVDEINDNVNYPPSPPEITGSSEKSPHKAHRMNFNLSDDVIQANNIIQSLNSFSSVAHIAGMGLKVIPSISPFTSLRSVNLSGNSIVHITAGSLPKSLNTLNLSRNKIVVIEGLRELTRLRVLDLSYNRISRIGQGLSNCTLIKELYLAGNKISDVEGLHRLLKLTVLDLSFNKITTAKALGQLVANYNSLLALNLLGNPVQTNIGDDHLRKAVSSLLPQLAYLNKQPIKPQRAREVAMDNVAKAALGSSGWNARRKASRRVAHGSSSSRGRISEGVAGRHRSRHRSKSRHH